MSRIDNAERARIFGPPCTPANHRTYLTPWGIRVPVHHLVLSRFAAACDLAKRASSWVPRRIDGYNCRTIRDSSSYSIHAWAMAWDFFVTPPNVPPPGGVWTPDNGVPPDFAAAFERHGFYWGANFGRKDVPHIEWAAGRPAAITSTATPPPTAIVINAGPTYEDATMQPHFVSLHSGGAKLDPSGRGYWDLPQFPFDRTVTVNPNVANPPEGGYRVPDVGFLRWGAGIRVVAEEAVAGGGLDVVVWLAGP